MRVVSLLPGATEMVAALGQVDALVGVTHECDHPPAVARLPRVTGTAVDVHAAPGAVDAQVRALHEAGGALFTLDAARFRELRPDLILTQALCDVCAVSETDVRALAARLDPQPRIVTLEARRLEDVFADLIRVGEALGVPSAAAAWVTDARARLQRVHETLKAAKAPRPRTAVIEWGDPIYAAGHWMPEMVKRAGGVDVLAEPGQHSVPVTLERLREADPELIVFAPCGYGLGRAVEEAERLLARPGWEWARERRAWALDANAYTSRPGPRLVDGVELLAAMVAPALFPPPDSGAAQAITEAAVLA